MLLVTSKELTTFSLKHGMLFYREFIRQFLFSLGSDSSPEFEAIMELVKYNLTSVKKKTFTINEKNKDLGLLKKVRKQERLRGDFWFWKLFWESWELFSARYEHSISVPDSTSLNHCITDKTLQHLFILLSSLVKSDRSCFHIFSAENSLSKGISIYYFETLHLGTRGCP